MNKLLFGTPGIPLSTKPSNTLNGIKQVKKLKLDAMELEFVRSINVNEKLAPEVKKLAKKLNIILTCHGQYWVNLASKEKSKYKASINRILSAARRLHDCGAWSATWHFAFYQNRPKEKVYEIVKKATKNIIKELQNESIKLWIRPETTGKPAQWGSLQETIKLSQDVEQVLPCIDYAHLHAREGKNNTFEEFQDILTKVEKALGKSALNNMHIQVSGINYGPKGEKNHLNLKESDFNWKSMLKSWKEFKIKGVVITESPNVENDTLLLKKAYKST